MLRPGGRFVAFDPNRMNPFMCLYRDRSSPFYSPVGVTENERPVLAKAGRAQCFATRVSGAARTICRSALSLYRLVACALAAAAL